MMVLRLGQIFPIKIRGSGKTDCGGSENRTFESKIPPDAEPGQEQ